jgi:hypothetical protein
MPTPRYSFKQKSRWEKGRTNFRAPAISHTGTISAVASPDFLKSIWINKNHVGARARNEGFGRQGEKVALFCFEGLDAQNHSVGFDQAAGASCAG